MNTNEQKIEKRKTERNECVRMTRRDDKSEHKINTVPLAPSVPRADDKDNKQRKKGRKEERWCKRRKESEVQKEGALTSFCFVLLLIALLSVLSLVHSGFMHCAPHRSSLSPSTKMF